MKYHIKINNVNNYQKIKIFKKVDIVHFHISETNNLNSLILSGFKDFIKCLPSSTKTSCSIERWESIEASLISSILSELEVDYFQCQAPEYFKEKESRHFVEKIKNISHKKIISGIQLYAEENIIDEIKGIRRLYQNDIAYFEIHLESLVDRGYDGFNKNQINEIEMFCKNYPVLLSDNFDSKKSICDYKIKANQGFFFDLKLNKNKSDKNYRIRELHDLIN